MNDLADSDFRRAYEAFGRRHDDQRMALLDMLPSSEAKMQAVRPRIWRGIPMRATLAAALLLIAASVAFFKMGPSERVYGIEGLSKRLMEVRSVHFKGWKYQYTMTKFGKALLRFPTEIYHERPYCLYGTHYGFSSKGNDELVQVTRSSTVGDDARTMRIDHDGKRAIVTPTDKLKAELRVESAIQVSLMKQLSQHEPGEYELVGAELVGGVMCNIYEHADPIGIPMRHRTKLWLNPDNGMPVKLASYFITPEEDEPFSEWSEIRFNVDPPPGMFSFAVPDGYEKIVSDDEKLTRSFFPNGGAGSNKHWASLGTAFKVGDEAVFVCWSQRTTVDGGQAWFHTRPIFTLSGAEQRPCDEITLRTDVGDEGQCRWSLIVPRDKRPVGNDSLNMVCRTEGPRSDTASLAALPLKFNPERLAELVEEVQRRTLPAGAADGDVWTMEELRSKLSE